MVKGSSVRKISSDNNTETSNRMFITYYLLTESEVSMGESQSGTFEIFQSRLKVQG